MTDFEFLVRQMRIEQKTYFRTRNPFSLALSKSLEKRVDSYLDQTDGKDPFSEMRHITQRLVFSALTVSTGEKVTGGITWDSYGHPYIVRMDRNGGWMCYAVQQDTITMEDDER